MTLPLLKSTLKSLLHTLEHGCGNHGCRIKPPTGMGTNAVCHCTPRECSKILLTLAAECEADGHNWRKEQ